MFRGTIYLDFGVNVTSFQLSKFDLMELRSIRIERPNLPTGCDVKKKEECCGVEAFFEVFEKFCFGSDFFGEF